MLVGKIGLVHVFWRPSGLTARIERDIARLTAAQPDIGPWRRQIADADFDQDRRCAERAFQDFLKLVRRVDPRIADIEGGSEPIRRPSSVVSTSLIADAKAPAPTPMNGERSRAWARNPISP